MPVRCNRKGGFGLKVEDSTGRVRRVKLNYGINDLTAEQVIAALARMPPAMAAELTARKPDGSPPEIDLDAPAPVLDGESKMSAADKVELVKAAGSLADLRALAEGEERKTVLAAIDRRAGELEAGEG